MVVQQEYILCCFIVLCVVLLGADAATINIQWPAANNIGPTARPGDTVHFVWNDGKPHNVLQVYNWTGNLPPLSPYDDAGFPGQIKSGNRVVNSFFDWQVGNLRTGYRPGIYFFVDEGNAAAGIVSVTLTYPESSDLFPKRPCSVLSDTKYYGGRYASYASRQGCTVYEVNNYQTEAHYDWVYPTFAMIQGDLIVFQWTNEHNIIQVHDVFQDELVPGGITSGPKKNCVPGPNWNCINQEQELAEYLFDSTNYRPGMIHISDECAYRCSGHTTGMNMQFFIQRPSKQRPPAPVRGSCCDIDPSKGTDCRVIDIYADEEGQQFNYNKPAGVNDLVRFRWAGSMQVYQSTSVNGAPTSTRLPGGYGMDASVECLPGPNWTCLEGKTEQAQWIFDIGAAIQKNLVNQDQYYNRWFTFYGVGENTDGFTSQSSGTIIYIDGGVSYNSNRSAVACPTTTTTTTAATTATTAAASTATSTTAKAATTTTTATTATTGATTSTTSTTKSATTTAASTATTKAATTTTTAATTTGATTSTSTTKAASTASTSTAKGSSTSTTKAASTTSTATTKTASTTSTSTTTKASSSTTSSSTTDSLPATTSSTTTATPSTTASSTNEATTLDGTTTTESAVTSTTANTTTSTTTTTSPSFLASASHSAANMIVLFLLSATCALMLI